MSEYGEYLVTGRRNYRGHTPGSHFEAQHDPAKQRAINRGDIQLIRVFTPSVPAEHEFPDGWLRVPPQANQGAPEGASLVTEGG